MSALGAACEGCLRRSMLIGHLAPRIASLLDRPRERTRGLLALEEDALIAAVAGRSGRGEAERLLERLDLDRLAARVGGSGLEAVCRHAPDYPAALAATADAPPVLWLRGGRRRLAEALAAPVVTLVGTRRPSAYGREVAHSLGRSLGGVGVTVVSGLALGVDAAAHRGCLEGNGIAVAVLANGPDLAHPRSHAELCGRIAERGVVTSELPPGCPPFRWSFPARNRIMAALGTLIVVVEAAERSGSLITAEFASQLGRTVGAVPGRVTADRAAGSNALLRAGAAVIRGARDALDELGLSGVRLAAPALPELDERSARVLRAVENGELDAVARTCGAGELRRTLARLEGDGLVVRGPLGRYERAA